MFDINGSKTKLDQESLFSSDHIEYWKCNIPVTQDQDHLKYNIKGFQGIKKFCLLDCSIKRLILDQFQGGGK